MVIGSAFIAMAFTLVKIVRMTTSKGIEMKIALVAITMAFALSACNTVKGFGKDVGGGWMTEGTAK